MVPSAADGYSVLLERTQTGQGLSGIGYGRVCALDDFYRLVCRGGDAAHVLDKVERGAFALEDSARLALDLGDDIALLQLVAVLLVDGRLKALGL